MSNSESSSRWTSDSRQSIPSAHATPPDTVRLTPVRDVLDILVQSRRNRRAAVRFFRKLLKRQGCVPRRLITDKLRSYPAACRSVMPPVVHCTNQYANNRAEVSHQPTRQRERQISPRTPNF